MVTTKTNGLFDRLRAKGLCSQAATDGDLLTCFIDQNDSAAFEALVRRHGPMILGVCQRLLRNDADAQDAVQATFLVLVRKAKSIRRRDGLACWLYGVAHNTALKARAMSRLRHAKERQAGSSRFESGPIGRENALEQQLTNLDLELRQLPLHYRSPIILCDLEGQTLQEAANALGCPFGTVASRLARGRALLAKRLSRHGVMFSVGSLVSALAANRASASLPCQVLSAIVHSGSAYAIGAPLATSALTSPSSPLPKEY